jgi:hypothetical protein
MVPAMPFSLAERLEKAVQVQLEEFVVLVEISTIVPNYPLLLIQEKPSE